MYPTIYHAVLDLFGLDLPFLKLVNSFGFFVALAFFAAAWSLSLDLKRREKLGQLQPWKEKEESPANDGILSYIYNGILYFIVGWKLGGMALNWSEVVANGNPQAYLLSSQGNVLIGILLAAALLGWKYYAQRKAKAAGEGDKMVLMHPYQLAGNIAIVGAIGGFIGAKFFHLFENPKEFVQFFREPSIENFLSGLTIYGGLIIGGIAVILYARTKGIKGWALPDAAAPGMMLSYGIGRIGCQVSGDGDWGVDNLAPKPGWLSWAPDWLWAYDYPNNVNRVGNLITDGRGCFEGYCTHLPNTVFPTPLYETTMAVIIFAILWAIRKRINVPGVVFGIYMMFNGVERFFIEKIRVNNVGTYLGIESTQAEFIAVLTFLAGLALVIWQWRKGKVYGQESI